MIRKIKNIFHLILSLLALLYYKFPAKKLIVIGITGTSGKTTTTHLIYDILKCAGFKASMISTVRAQINDENYDTGFHVTTPSPFSLQKLIKKTIDGGSKILVLEVTSHALDQFRTFGIPFEIAVITNIAHEHLDYHNTIDNYRRTKARIMFGSKHIVLNRDDKNYNFLSRLAKGNIVTFGIVNDSMVNIDKKLLNNNLPGLYNQYNILAAKAVATLLKVDKKIIYKAIRNFVSIPGRMEQINTKKPFSIYIDFAHKPDALEAVLETAKNLVKNKLIVIFGCAGLRDKLKRPMMGKIASKYADYVILTAEDPRTEDVREIINNIEKGCILSGAKLASKNIKEKDKVRATSKYYWKIPDRQEAINYAIKKLAKIGDLILICGKGHEKSMCYGNVEYPWDDKNAVKKALL